MKFLLGVFLVFNMAVAYASDLAKIAGKYKYEKCQITWKDGRVEGCLRPGERAISIEFKKDATIVMSVHMLDGRTIATKAHIKKIEINGNKGHWIAQWPDMNYTVRKDFSFHEDVFEYAVKFDSRDDHIMYGAVERARLRKINTY